jgi:hypothetical protein
VLHDGTKFVVDSSSVEAKQQGKEDVGAQRKLVTCDSVAAQDAWNDGPAMMQRRSRQVLSTSTMHERANRLFMQL